MNKILSTIVATLVVVPLTSAVFAADATKPVVPAPPVVASQPAAAATATNKADRLRERNKNAKAASESVKKPVVPASPAVEATAAKRVNKLQERKMRARANTKALGTTVPNETAPVAPATAK